MIHILKENKDLINTVYVIGDNLLKHLENTYKNYKGDKTKEGYKRLRNLIEMSKNGGIKFNEMKRLKNWFDNNHLNKETDEYKLNGGDLMRDWINSQLYIARKISKNRKKVLSGTKTPKKQEIQPEKLNKKINIKKQQ